MRLCAADWRSLSSHSDVRLDVCVPACVQKHMQQMARTSAAHVSMHLRAASSGDYREAAVHGTLLDLGVLRCLSVAVPPDQERQDECDKRSHKRTVPNQRHKLLVGTRTGVLVYRVLRNTDVIVRLTNK